MADSKLLSKNEKAITAYQVLVVRDLQRALAAVAAAEKSVSDASAIKDPAKAKKATATAKAALAKAQKALTQIENRIAKEKVRLAAPLAALERNKNLQLEVQAANQAIADARDEYEWALSNPCKESDLPTGISAELVSSSIYPVNLADPAVPGSADSYSFKLQYSVTAVGQDVYVDRTPNQLSSVGDLAYVEGAAWALDPIDSSAVVRGQVLSASGSATGDSLTGFLVRDGESRTFTLTVVLEASADTSAGIRLTSINWSPSSEEGVDEKTFAEGLEDFKTKYQFMGVI